MLWLSPDRITDVALYGSVALLLFVLARLGNVGPALALTIAIMPVLAAWVFTNPSAHDFIVGALRLS